MSKKKDPKQSYRAVLASLKREMAKPRLAGSAQTKVESQRAAAVKVAGKT
jgi:hypothetical protein